MNTTGIPDIRSHGGIFGGGNMKRSGMIKVNVDRSLIYFSIPMNLPFEPSYVVITVNGRLSTGVHGYAKVERPTVIWDKSYPYNTSENMKCRAGSANGDEVYLRWNEVTKQKVEMVIYHSGNPQYLGEEQVLWTAYK